MKIMILNGNPDSSNSGYEKYIKDYSGALVSKGSSVRTFTLRDMDIKFCSGCWSCWWKTPGKCAFADGAEEIYREILRSDLLIYASPMIMGFTSALIKKINDRCVPLIMPYVEISKGEMRHLRRYNKFPDIALLLSRGADTDDEDIGITTDIYKRLALNMRTTFKFCRLMDTAAEEAANETLAA